MRRWERVDEARVPGSDSVTTLLRSGDRFAILIDGRPLMGTDDHRSEDALGTLGCAHLTGREGARVLVGGLGLGFTLAAALRAVPPDAEVVVAELSPATIRWNRDLCGAAAGHPLQDPRVTLVEGDVAEQIRAGAWDAVLLDVDNGPAALTHPANAALYGAAGISAARRSLQPGGVLAVWSAAPDPAFTRRLRGAGFADVREVALHGRVVVWLAALGV